jgi:hypothetical protein
MVQDTDMRQHIAIDFDGTICKQGPFTGNRDIPYEPEPFAKEALTKLSEYFIIDIYSVRANRKEGVEAIAAWMKKYQIPYSHITDKKGPAIFYIDNRAIHYDGNWMTTLKQVATLQAVEPMQL